MLNIFEKNVFIPNVNLPSQYIPTNVVYLAQHCKALDLITEIYFSKIFQNRDIIGFSPGWINIGFSYIL